MHLTIEMDCDTRDDHEQAVVSGCLESSLTHAIDLLEDSGYHPTITCVSDEGIDRLVHDIGPPAA
jgi:hypothetical protein